MTEGRIVIIPFLHGEVDADGSLTEPDIDAILEKWLQRHPQFRGTAEDADLYEDLLAEKGESTPRRFHEIWIEPCEGAQGIEDEFGTQKALEYLVGEKFLNYLEAAESNADFRAEIPAFVAKIKEIFEPWQLADYLPRARETEPFDPGLFEPSWDPELGEEEIEFDAEEIEEMRKHDIRQTIARPSPCPLQRTCGDKMARRCSKPAPTPNQAPLSDRPTAEKVQFEHFQLLDFAR
jgi:hypothetical protein